MKDSVVVSSDKPGGIVPGQSTCSSGGVCNCNARFAELELTIKTLQADLKVLKVTQDGRNLF